MQSPSAVSSRPLVSPRRWWFAAIRLLGVLLVWGAIVGFSAIRYQPPTARPASAPADQFSAHRAQPRLQAFLTPEAPRPAGSQRLQQARAFLQAELQALGYEVQSQTGTGQVHPSVQSRSPDRTQVPLHNLIAELPGSRGTDGCLLVVAHYDSVPMGPGASDNGVGVAAVLEVARLWREVKTNRRVVFLFTDGEEFGLLGANLFAEEHPLMDDVGLVINLDARGTTGPSLMFETGPRTAELIPLFDQASRRPFASSLFYEVYRRLPRDTDFSVFKRAGLDGFNFAFIGRVENYHTPADNLQQVNLDSLQHHGENLWRLVQRLSQPDCDDLFEARTENAEAGGQGTQLVYFDFFGWRIIHWPVGVSWLAAPLLALIWLGGWIRRGDFRRGSWWGGLWCLVIWLTCTAAGMLIVFRLAQRDAALAHPWPAHPVALEVAIWCAGLALMLAFSSSLLRWCESKDLVSALALLWVALTGAVTLFMTGASFLFLLPAAALLLACKFTPEEDGGIEASGPAAPGIHWSWLGAVAAGLLWLPLERLFYDALGFRMDVAVVVRATLVLSSLIGLIATLPPRLRPRLAWSALLASVGLLLWASQADRWLG